MTKSKDKIVMPTGCPKKSCGSEEIEYGDSSIDGDEASQECRCLICYAVWHDVFKFTHRQVED